MYALIKPLCVLLLMATTLSAQAQTDDMLKANDPRLATTTGNGRWQGSGTASFSMQRGNSNSETTNVNAEIFRATEDDKWNFTGKRFYSRSRDMTGESTISSNLTRLQTRYDRNINQRWFGFVGGGWESDPALLLNRRVSIFGGPGLHVIKETDQTLDVYLGLNKRYDRYDAPGIDINNEGIMQQSANSLEAMLGDEYWLRITSGIIFRQKLTLYRQLENLQHTRAEATTSLGFALSKGMTLEISIQDNFNNENSPPAKKNDWTFLTGLTFSFGE